MEFYQSIPGGELKAMTYGESPMGDKMPEPAKRLVMHSHLVNEKFTIMASDTMPDHQITVGNNISVMVVCDSDEEVNTLFDSFSQGAKITMPVADQFWNARFGTLTDKFGINWMFNHERNRN